MSIAVKVEDLSKRYRLGVINRDMLYKDLQSRWAKIRGKPDPNAPITHIHQNRIEKGDEFWALRNINLEIEEGEILGVIGRNGAGKSTLLKVLSQITAPTEGCIKINGRIASLLEVGTGFHPELTGRENVFLNGAILGMSRKEIKLKFDEIVEFSNIEEFIDTPVKRYSSGMYVRLAFAVAAHLEPEILVVDEVLAVGDAEFQKKCLGKMKEVSRKQGRTVLFVSHNMASVRQLCSRSICLDSGQILKDGPSEYVIDEYLSEEHRVAQTFAAVKSADGAFAVNRVVIKNNAGEKVSSIAPGDPLVIELCLEAVKLVKDPYLWVAITYAEQTLCLANTLLDGFRFGDLEGEYTVRVCFKSLPLNPQHSYFVTIGARHSDAVRELLPPTVVSSLMVNGSAADCAFESPVADRWLAYSPGLTLPYEWNLQDGRSKSVNLAEVFERNK